MNKKKKNNNLTQITRNYWNIKIHIKCRNDYLYILINLQIFI